MNVAALSLLLLVTSTVPAVTPPTVTAVTVTLPWATFSEAAKDSTGQSGLGACVTGTKEVEVFTTRLVHDRDAYAYWYEPESGRIVWVVWIGNKEGSYPDAIGVGIVDLKTEHASDLIPTLHWKAFNLEENGDGPCPFLVGQRKFGA